MGNEDDSMSSVHIIGSEKQWIEGEAIRQLKHVSQFEGMVYSVGLPDLHPGKGTPIGAAFFSHDIIYPHLVGNDIGCGMGLWLTDQLARKVKLDKWQKKLSEENLWRQPISVESGLHPTEFDKNLGSVGGGNHFAELQSVSEVVDENLFDQFQLDRKRVYLLVHSGSRGLGEHILRCHTSVYGAKGLKKGNPLFQDYLGQHDHAVAWAKVNRITIAARIFSGLNIDGQQILDIVHNSVIETQIKGQNGYLHRKGAAPSDKGLVAIPGSRGAPTYLVAPCGDGQVNALSVAHGAGRKWKRSECRGRLEKRFSPDQLVRTELNSRVICHDKNLLYEEAPQAYKKIDQVVLDLVDAGLIDVVALLKPMLTYKTLGGSR